MNALTACSLSVLLFLIANLSHSQVRDDDSRGKSPAASGLEVITLGTGTPKYSPVRSRPASLVVYGNLRILVDAGSGTEGRLYESGLSPAQVGHILITHHHIDHNGELPQFLVLGSVRQSLESVVGPPGTTEFAGQLLDFYREDLAYRTGRQQAGQRANHDLALKDLEGGESFELGPLIVTTARVNHTIHTVAYRFDSRDGDSIVISGDLSWSDSLVELAKGADILVIDSGGMPSAEGSSGNARRQGQDRRRTGERPAGGRPGRERAHASLEDVARMAQAAGAATLVLTHIGHDRVDEEQVRQRVSALYAGRLEIASDGARYSTGSSAPVPAVPAAADRPDGSFSDNGDGTVSDLQTGLTWQKSPDTDGNGVIDARDKRTVDQAEAGAQSLELAGRGDWRLPTIKELYSLIDFSGIDPGGYRGSDTSVLEPFIDTRYFDFAYGDTARGERIIDAQFASSTASVSPTGPRNSATRFGVNFADGRIKGYGLNARGRDKTFFVLYVRGESAVSGNDFADNGDGTITDSESGLMWARDDSGEGMDWDRAQAWVDAMNARRHLGHDDWRLPTAVELQGIVDYSRSPGATGSAAIDPLFRTSEIVNEAGEKDYPYFWTSTTHRNSGPDPDGAAVYIAFGRAMGYMRGQWVDAHGAGAQRSDPKTGDPGRFHRGRGPQGDAIRIENYVRLVRENGN